MSIGYIASTSHKLHMNIHECGGFVEYYQQLKLQEMEYKIGLGPNPYLLTLLHSVMMLALIVAMV